MSVEIRRELREANIEVWKTRIIERNLRDKKQGLHRSLYYSLGAELIEDGKRGLLRLSAWLGELAEERVLHIDSPLYKTLQEEHPKKAQKFKNDYSKIWAGFILKSSEEILCGNDDRVSGAVLCAWHNEATKYTYVPALRPLKGVYPYVTPNEREELLKVHREDETNVSLIGQNINKLPVLLTKYAEYAQVVPNIISHIEPFSSQVANELKVMQQQHARVIVAKLAPLG